MCGTYLFLLASISMLQFVNLCSKPNKAQKAGPFALIRKVQKNFTGHWDSIKLRETN